MMRAIFALIILFASLLSPSISDDTTVDGRVLTLQPQSDRANEYDDESARKIIGSRVVTSVSVVMNGKEPQFADAVGNYVPRPLVPPRVASPVSLLDPDRYEFYTFNDEGELVKRLMTMEEIQSIVANGDSEQQAAMAKNPSGSNDHETNIRNIVNNVQKVLHSEMAHNNFTAALMHNKLDTPDTSSSWSSILPAIFGNTGESILTNKVPVTMGSTADSVLMQSTHKNPPFKKKPPTTSSILKTTLPPKTTVTKITKQKPKPSRPISSTIYTTLKPSTRPSSSIQNTKFTPITQITQNVKNTLKPSKKTTQSQNSTTFTSKPTKTVTVGKPLSTLSISSSSGTSNSPTSTLGTSLKPTNVYVQKISTQKITQSPGKVTFAGTSSVATKKPISKRPSVSVQDNVTSSVSKISPTLLISSTTRLPTTGDITLNKKNKITNVQTIASSQSIITTPTKTMTSATTTQKPKTTKITSNLDELREVVSSTVRYTTSPPSLTTKKTITRPTHASPQTMNPDSLAVIEPEPDNVFDSELSLNQIIESLKDLEGTTVPFASNYMDFMDMTTFEPDALPISEKFIPEPITIMNNLQSPIKQSNTDTGTNGFESSIGNNVSYIPQTTLEYLQFTPTTEDYVQMRNHTKTGVPLNSSTHYYQKVSFSGIEHKESDDDDMILNDKTTTESETETDAITTTESLSKQSTNSMDTLLRESFDSVLSQIQDNNELSTTINNDVETTSLPQLEYTTTMRTNDKKKTILQPTPYIPMEEIEGVATEPMKYFEAVIKHYEEERNKSHLSDKNNSTKQKIPVTNAERTTEKPRTTEAMDLIETTTDDEMHDQFTTTEETMTQTVSLLRTNLAESEGETTPIPTEMIPIANESSTVSIGNSTAKTTTLELETVKETTDASESSTVFDEEYTTKLYQTTTELDSLGQTTVADSSYGSNENQTQYEMIQLIENIVKNMTNDTSIVERKEDSTETSNKTSDIENYTETTRRAETEYSDLGEATSTESPVMNQNEKTKIKSNASETTKPPSNKLKVPTLGPILNNLKMKVVNALKNVNTINLEPAPKQALGLEESTVNAGEDILEFAKFCNEVAFNFWIALNNEGISSARSLTLSPFALTSMLGALFLGARGRTSGEINDMLHLDDIVTFNPHAILRNISDSIDDEKNLNVYNNVFVRELLIDRSKGKILPFFKEKVNQFYSGYVEEVNFSTVNDIIRRRTNLLMKRYTNGKTNEYLKASNVWVKPPLATISANLFETDCSKASKSERDGEMFFQILPAIRQRRLIPIPAVVWKSGFTAGYDPELDATAVAIGLSNNIVSTIFVMPGQQGHSAPGDNLERLESVLMANAVPQNAWRRLLATLMERPGLEVQIPRFTHRSFVNATNALRKLGLETLFDQNSADLRGITGSIGRDIYVSDLIQINTFSTCGEDKLAEEHHVEMYPAPPNKHRTMEYNISNSMNAKVEYESVPMGIDSEIERAFASDPIYDLRYLNLPLPLRPRQARVPDIPRLRFDKPFVYFVRHNPTGMLLYFGRFNPRLLP